MKAEAGEQAEKRGGLEIEEDLNFQRRNWQMERVSWFLIALLILAALLGVFGNGWLSHAKAVDASGTLQVEYERLARLSVPLPFQFRVQASQMDGATGELRLWLNRACLEDARVEAILPAPERVEAAADRTTYLFRVTNPAAPLDLTFYLTPQRPGRWQGQAGTGAGAQVNFAAFIYP